MSRVPSWVTATAMKYLPDVPGTVGRVKYEDAWLEADRIIIPTGEMSQTLEGWAAWMVPVVKGKPGKPEEIVIGEPSPIQFTVWARQQKASILRELLKAQGIIATSDIIYVLAYRLAFEYERISLTKADRYVLSPKRQFHIAAYDLLLHSKGVSSEAATVLVLDACNRGSLMELRRKVNDMAREEEKGESNADIRKRLLKQKQDEDGAAETEKEEGERDVDQEKGKGKAKRGSKKDEAAVIKAGKGGTKSEPEEPEPAEAEASTDHEETDDMKKRNATTKRAATATAKKRETGTTKKSGLTRRDVPIGSMVKIVGGRNEKYQGKNAEVLAHHGESGLRIKIRGGALDGMSLAVMPSALEVTKRGSGKSSEK